MSLNCIVQTGDPKSGLLNCIVQTGNLSTGHKGFITYHKVKGLAKFERFLNTKHPGWLWYTTYKHSNKEKIEVVKNEENLKTLSKTMKEQIKSENA